MKNLNFDQLLDKLKNDIELNISGTAVCDKKPYYIESCDLKLTRLDPASSPDSSNCIKILDLIDSFEVSDLSLFIRLLCSKGLYNSYLKDPGTFRYIFNDKFNKKEI